MTYRDALFAGAVLAMGTAGAAAMATFGELPFGGNEVRAEAVGFDVLAHRVFGGNDCTASLAPDTTGTKRIQ